MRDKWITLGAAIAVVTVMISLFIFTLAQKAHDNKTINDIRYTNQRACIASNVNRAAASSSDFLTWKGLKQTIQYTAANNAAQYAALSKLGISKAVLQSAEHESTLQLANQTARLHSLYWIELTNCAHQAKSVTVYMFDREIPSPAQLSIANAEHISPKGF